MSTPMNDKAREALIARCERDAHNLTFPFMEPTIKDQHEAAQTLRDCAAALQWAASQQAAGGAPGVAGLERCQFDDECDFCRNPQGGSFTRLIHNAEDCTEAEFYLCGDCAWKAVDAFKSAAPTAQGEREPFLPGELERMTENGRKAWAGVDPQSLRDGSYQAQGERDEQ